MKSVFILQHSYETGEGHDETKFIGTYSTEEKAKEAIERLKLQNGFKDRPNDFCIDEYELDKDHWTEGYVTIAHIQVRNGDKWVVASAECLINGTYRIIKDYYEDDSGNEFQANDIVRCEERTDSEGTDTYAVELIKKGEE